ncbi:MAG TPA: PVC-type heme-binding CxxCH protein [Tepidisphaeraceae bacterium]|nr:PVC-type heme-binding CxxCH protein [Tepidisphaeraceae bacterium]
MALSIAIVASPASAAPEPPRSADPSAKISLFASEPQIVTPIGATVDAKGRLMVIESNSHFRPKNYQGPATDRILILEDTKGAGKADRITTFFEGENLLMNLAADPDGSIVVASRYEIFRLTPSPGGGAPRKTSLAHLDTKGNYPHDGLEGLAIDPAGNVSFAIGENLGAPWTLIGTDGKSIHETRGTGCIFRVDRQGHGLVRLARGLWNPFGLGLDPNGTLWAVDNDPDGRPPSRLLQVTPGGDYGFEFRYGRTGLHPLQAWNGELPGTLGMISGVGEAPCNVKAARGMLWVSSWRDHQVETYTLTPSGATYHAAMQPLLTGGLDFRPVGLAFARDGMTLYISDWGSASYSVNGIGRVWKVTFTHPASAHFPAQNNGAKWANDLQHSHDINALIAALGNDDPVIHQSACYGLSQTPGVEKIDWASLTLPQQRIGLLSALLWREADVTPFLDLALQDPDPRVREMGVRAATEQGIAAARPKIEKLLDSTVMTPRLLGMIAAAIAQLDGDPAARVNTSKVDDLLLAKLNAPQTAAATKAVLLRMLPASKGAMKISQLSELLKSPAPALQLEAARYLSDMSDPNRFGLLAQVAQDGKQAIPIRAEAVVGLANDAAGQADLLVRLAQGNEPALRAEALRSLRAAVPVLTAPQRGHLEKVAAQFPAQADMVNRLLGHAPAARPPEHDVPAWEKILDQAPGDPAAGRRIFFSPSGPACFRCHTIEGRGRSVGPDLTMIGHSQQRSHILESILDPSREIAPLYTNWHITLKDGQTIDGMLLRRDGQEHEVYVDASGQELRADAGNVIDRKIRKESIMPEGLVQALTDQELRDLLAMLGEQR